MSTKIQWTDETWNPTTGCTRVSEGCRNCYIERTPAFRIKGRKFVNGSTGVLLHPDRLEKPLHWKQPRRIFVNSLSDLFHEEVPDEFIDRVLGVVMLSPWHTYQVLTKRQERLARYFSGDVQDRLRTMNLNAGMLPGHIAHMNRFSDWQETHDPETYGFVSHWPLKNLWLGVSCEDQQTAAERIPILLQTPAAVRWISAEPLLGPVDLRGLGPLTAPLDVLNGIRFMPGFHGKLGSCEKLDWVVVGGESGPGARPCDLAWIRAIVRQCKRASAPVFVKQLGRYVCDGQPPNLHQIGWLKDKKGGDIAEFPNDLQVREYPR